MNDPLLRIKTVAAMMRQAGGSDADVFRAVLACFEGTPYVWGGSTPAGCDCSGTVCTALNVIYGANRDKTAHELYETYFTCCDDRDETIGAVFFLRADNHAVHIAGRISGDYFMNESAREKHGGTIRAYDDLVALYPEFRPVYRSLRKGAWQ